VVEGADLANGLLHVALRHLVPEALGARRITVRASRPAIAGDAAPARAA
jgi:molecular chaperone IbpA